MDAASIFLARKLIETIEEKQREMLRPLVRGQALDFPDYKKRAGYLEALSDVMGWIEQINTEEEDERVDLASTSPYSDAAR